MPPKRSTRSSAAGSSSTSKATPAKKATAAKTPAASTSKVSKTKTTTKKTTSTTASKRTASTSRVPAPPTTTRVTRSRAGSQAPSVNSNSADALEVAEGSIIYSLDPPETVADDAGEAETVASTVEDNQTAIVSFNTDTALVPIEEEQYAIATIESTDEQQDDGMLMPSPVSMERVLTGPASIVHELTGGNKQDLILSMRDEIINLRKTIEEMTANQPSPSPDVRRVLKRDLRFEMTIGAPARALAAKIAEEEQQEQERQARLQQEADAAAAAAATESPEPEHSQAQKSLQTIQAKSPKTSFASMPSFSSSTTASSSFDRPKTPTSSWSFNIFSSAKKLFTGRKSEETSFEQQQGEAQQDQQSQSQTLLSQTPPHSQTTIADLSQTTPSKENKEPTESSSPFSPSMTPTKTPVASESTRKPRQQHHTPPSDEPITQTPARSVRRRGLFPGSVNRAPRPASTQKPKPVETNADKRDEIMRQIAAEREEIAREHAASQKRIQEQAKMIEDEKRKAEEEQQKLDDQDAANHQVGGKRKRVRVDDLVSIPSRLPGQGSGCFSFREEFFTYDDDEDDYVEMDVDEADELITERPAKKMKMQDNVFQASTPQKEKVAPAATAPATPHPGQMQQHSAKLDRALLAASAHKPKVPSGLSQVFTGSSPASTGPTPRQISAATPAPLYYNTPGAPLTNITERTEPETPAAVSATPMPITPTPVTAAATPAPAKFTPAAAAAPPLTSSSRPASSSSFSFPNGVPLWIAYPDIFTEEIVKEALAIPMTPAAIDTATEAFAAGCAARLTSELSSSSSSTAIRASY